MIVCDLLTRLILSAGERSGSASLLRLSARRFFFCLLIPQASGDEPVTEMPEATQSRS